MKTTRRGGAAGFTLIEIMVSITVVALLLSLLIVGMRYALRAGQGAADRANVVGLRTGVEQFRQKFGFLPPMVGEKDPDFTPDPGQATTVQSPSNRRAVNVYKAGDPLHLRLLRARNPSPRQPDEWDPRYSTRALAYYLAGVLEERVMTGSPLPIDGVSGPGFLTPNADGTFKLPELDATGQPRTTRVGEKFEPFVAAGKKGMSLFTDPADIKITELRDRNNKAYRYYRWSRGNPDRVSATNREGIEDNADLNVPLMVGDPATNPALRDASFAIVAAGPDGVFGDEDLLPVTDLEHLTIEQMRSKLGVATDVPPAQVRAAARKDNVVEAGK